MALRNLGADFEYYYNTECEYKLPYVPFIWKMII